MAALVQAFPTQQSSAPVSLLQARPQSASATLQSNTQIQSHAHAMQQRAAGPYGSATGNNSSGAGGYRSYSGSAPVAPYAFTSTPGLTNSHNKQTQQQQQQQQQQAWSDKNAAGRQLAPEETRLRYPVSDTSSSSSSISSEPPLRYHHSTPSQSQSQQQQPNLPPRSNSNNSPRLASTAAPLPSPPILPAATSSKPSPDRYRRGKGTRPGSPTVPSPAGSAMPSGSGMAAVSAHYTPLIGPGRTNGSITAAANAGGMVNQIASYTGQLRSQSVDDINAYRNPSALNQQQKQQRRRSVGAFSPESLNVLAGNNGQIPERGSLQLPSFATQGSNQRVHTSTGSASNMVARRGSNDSSASVNSSSSHSHHPNSSPNNNASAPTLPAMSPSGSHEINLAHVPPRDSSQLNKRTTAPSPLSKPVTMNSEPNNKTPTSPQPRNSTSQPLPSAAAERLAALSADPHKGLKNRLRRAFSFGSAAELRKAAAGNSTDAAERIRLRQERFREEQQAEQSKIVQQQEASGLGEGIYNGQGNIFSGSTDNLSVSSTASSASIMIRKMGKGMKKSTRSLVGLFRPRSVVGVPAASGPVGPEPPAAQVTVVNVEADREKLKSSDSTEQPTGAPELSKLPQAALEPAINQTAVGDGIVQENLSEIKSRRSCVDGDKERAEILAAVKKGILKRSGSSSPIIKPADSSANYTLSNASQPHSEIPPETSRGSPAHHQRDNSITIEGEDYFMKSPRFLGGKVAGSAPASPNGSKGNVTFSPRITFHDTWPSGEYDRRGDIATCNRLTPALAQQIKEELNTFKMEMDVHEESKIYTHFF